MLIQQTGVEMNSEKPKYPYEYKEWLKKEDKATRSLRADRLRFLVETYGEPRHLLLPGGPISFYAFEESRLCFLNGQFIGCILLSQVVLEHILDGLFKMAGRDDLERAGFQLLTREALSEGYISQNEYDAFNLLRDRRNPYVHPRDPMDKKEFVRRMVMENKAAEMLFEEDARMAIQTIFRLLSRYPFAFPGDGYEEL